RDRNVTGVQTCALPISRVFTQAATPVARQRVRVRVIAAEGAPLVTVWSLEKQPGGGVTVKSTVALGAAQNCGVSIESLRQQLGQIGRASCRERGAGAGR